MKLYFDVADKPKFRQLIVFAFQQMLAIMAATIAVPMIVGHGLSPAAAMLGAGMGTIVYILLTILPREDFGGRWWTRTTEP